MDSSPRMMAPASLFDSTPILRSMAAWASEPRMSCRQSRQSKEMDSVNCATSAPGPRAKRPLRETGEIFFICWSSSFSLFGEQAQA